jgi:hypothetical protein
MWVSIFLCIRGVWLYLCDMIKLKDLVYNRSKEFLNWFGDSKVVDKDNNPLVVYKGYYPFDGEGKEIKKIHRPGEFPTFNKRGEPYDVNEKGVTLAGFFTDDILVPKMFMFSKKSVLKSFYLKIEKPYIIDMKGGFSGNAQFGEEGRPFRDAIRSGKYDGVFILNTKDEGNVYVPLRPNQIKSTDNVVFDPNDDEFMKERS